VFLSLLVTDVVVESLLMSLGMMILPPSVVSLPLKLIFFVLIDGWRLVAGSLTRGFAAQLTVAGADAAPCRSVRRDRPSPLNRERLVDRRGGSLQSTARGRCSAIYGGRLKALQWISGVQ
jgi:hypothetical protein